MHTLKRGVCGLGEETKVNNHKTTKNLKEYYTKGGSKIRQLF